MRHLIREITWVVDFYFVYFLYSDKKKWRYHYYMLKRWDSRYKKKLK